MNAEPEPVALESEPANVPTSGPLPQIPDLQSDPHSPMTMPAGIPHLDQQGAEMLAATHPTTTDNEVVLITGMSGAGRSRAAAALEDLEWYVVNNIPPALLPALAGMMTPAGEGVHRLAVVVDARSRTFFSGLSAALTELRAQGVNYRIVFLETTDEELVRRYEASRRPHPLQGAGTLVDGLRQERELLAPLREQADEIVDTTNMSVNDIALHMRNVIADEAERKVSVTIMSFGFKHGLPLDADHVLDVRFLKNPYWVDELRKLTGRDAAVFDYVLTQPGVKKFATTYADLIASTLDGYRQQLKPFVTVTIGCTGGRHRSVAISEYVAGILRQRALSVHVVHRDIGRK